MKKVFLLLAIVFGLFAFLPLNVMAEQNASCKTECAQCASVCKKTLAYCNKQGGEHVQPAHIKALKDCITACKQSADSIAKGSQLQNHNCKLCEEACLKCAQSCEAFKDDKTMQACAEECRKCAQSCHNMTS